MSAPVLQVESLTGGYGPSQVLFGIDLEVHEGQVITLLGRNGMGKTTSVRHLLGLNRAYSGEIRFLGQSITGLPADQIARRGMAVVPERLSVGQIGQALDEQAQPLGEGGAALERGFAGFANNLIWWAEAAKAAR